MFELCVNVDTCECILCTVNSQTTIVGITTKSGMRRLGQETNWNDENAKSSSTSLDHETGNCPAMRLSFRLHRELRRYAMAPLMLKSFTALARHEYVHAALRPTEFRGVNGSIHEGVSAWCVNVTHTAHLSGQCTCIWTWSSSMPGITNETFVPYRVPLAVLSIFQQRLNGT